MTFIYTMKMRNTASYFNKYKVQKEIGYKLFVRECIEFNEPGNN